ncbi:hypothetical protein [Reyranella sp.]|uniref:hypothetical protein n=1 Tax=Reyranella sp. TaxID=1929291 RepID=UPI003C7E0E33
METQPSLGPVLERLQAYRKAADLSYSRLARLAGLSRAALLGMDAEDWSPSSTTIRAIESLIPSTWRVGDPVPETIAKPGKARAA